MYTATENIRRKKTKRTIFWVLISMLLIVLIGGTGFIIFDVSNTSQEVESTGGTIINKQATEQFITFDEPSFTFQAPGDWVKVNPKDSWPYNVVKFQSTKEGYEARMLEIYINDLPESFATNRVYKVSIEDNRIMPELLSPPCYSFTKPKIEPVEEHVVPAASPSTWEETEFLCEFTKTRNVITAGNPRDGIQLSFNNRTTADHVTIVYTDHTAQQDSNIFKDILKTFKHK